MVPRRHHLPDPQSYAVDQLRDEHEDALWGYGEYTMFVLLWRIQDHDAGLVDRCSECYLAYGATAEAYRQPVKNECPSCFGTSFEGGYKAKIIRPAKWVDTEEAHIEGSRGELVTATAQIESTSDFRMRTNDYVLRANGTRWQMRQVMSASVHTGFQLSSTQRDVVGFGYGEAARQPDKSVAYLIPPETDDLITLLDVPPGSKWPKDWTDDEDIQGSLI